MKYMFSSLVLTLALAVGIGIPAVQVLHAQAPEAAMQDDVGITAASTEEGGAVLLNGLEVVSMVLAGIAMFILVLIIRQFGTSTISIIFGYFFIGTALLASARLFILFASLGILNISDETLNMGWHLLFFLSMITFFIAGKGFSKLGAGTEVTENFSKVVGYGLVCTILAVLMFVLAPVIDAPFTAMFAQSIADRSGLVHAIAVVLGGIAAFYLFHKAKLGQVTSLLAAPYLISFGLFALNHVWELMFESWHIVNVSGSTGERIEQFFVLPAFMLITYAYIRLWSFVRPRV